MAVESPFLAAVISHSEIADFAADNINLRAEDVEDYREQVRLLREKLDRYAADHEEHGLIKTPGAGCRVPHVSILRRGFVNLPSPVVSEILRLAPGSDLGTPELPYKARRRCGTSSKPGMLPPMAAKP